MEHLGSDAESALDSARHCLLIARGERAPVIGRAAFWWDGAAIWLTASPASPHAAALRSSPRCLIYVPDVGGSDLSAEGMARLYEAGDAVTAAVHGPSIAAALAALAVKHARELIARARSALLDPPAGFGPLPVVIRVGLERNAFEAPPDAAPPGLAPALPIMIPPAVRRALSGQRRVAVATQQAGHLRIGPALWSDDFRLALPTWRQLAADEPAAVIAQSAHSEDRAAADWATTAALALEGPIGERGELRPARGTWWLGSQHGDIDLSAASDDGVTIPD